MPLIKPVSAAPAPPQQHKQPSRKGKKAWRKNVDVTEIQDGLEEVRDELIQGGIIAEKGSAELFTFDTTGDASVSKKLLKGSKPLKADVIIAQRSAVPAVSMRKDPARAPQMGLSNLNVRELAMSPTKNSSDCEILPMGDKTRTSLKSRKHHTTHGMQKKILKKLSKIQDSPFKKAQKKKAPKTIKHKPITLAASGKEIPAVKKPKGGYSYNPVFTDYEERLTIEGERELAAEQKRLAAIEEESVRLEASARSAAEAEAAEARVELSEWQDDSAWEGIESGTEDVRLTAKRPERKTQVQRNKIKRRKEEERKAKMKADIKKMNEQASQAKKIAKAVAAKDNARALVLASKDDSSSEGDDLELRRRKLGKIMLPEKDLELVLPDELQESLRLLKPEGNLLKDSFAKKAKRKATEKWTHKDFMLH